MLPPPAALERFMGDIGAASKQTGKARQAFIRSARQGGYFAHGEDRHVRPAAAELGGPGTKPIEEPKKADQDGDKGRKLRNGGNRSGGMTEESIR